MPIFSNHLYLQAILAIIFTYDQQGGISLKSCSQPDFLIGLTTHFLRRLPFRDLDLKHRINRFPQKVRVVYKWGHTKARSEMIGLLFFNPSVKSP